MNLAPFVEEQVAAWRATSEQLRWYGAEEQAAAVNRCADELESNARAHEDAPLTLDEAAGESGYSRDHIGRLIRDGKVPNAGKPGAPLIRRADLPVKTTSLISARSNHDVPSVRQIVQSVVTESG